MWERQPYCFASDTINVLSDGRIILPVEMSIIGVWGSKNENIILGCVVSDDNGMTWRICSGWIKLPMRGAMEGHVEELKDGRLIMVMRNQLGAVFKSYSTDRGETWSKPQTTGMRAPESCPELIRVPGSGKLMLVWNNSEYDPDFRSHYGKRSPLSIALSDDEGETFYHVGDIETNRNWAYSNPGAYFLKNEKCVLNYWAVKYTPDWVMKGNIHLKLAIFDIE
jgi:sialidase-1